MKKTYCVLVRFEIQKDDFQFLISLIKIFFATEVSPSPGFISSQIITNEDKSTVINYATWESKEEFEKFAQEIVSKSKISKKIEVFKPVRETFYEYEFLPKRK
ncbi:Antibiotic biosynthesis monooxygenase [Galbibacter orientalis DSM 19592]|uniref:Antibiotic biosynthesis monooxygenase n=1 Tax=Galbibacter orientalis DSM 19592 TaxID=926559 RepID=I3C655_9FLAO|nr:antibiotic biosynthesis monooxygenase [Galbibacter orientalis]EIJ39098.1 Antibiotic biosynthesis monooxygenase [Galbibacter orientalis DSM 19592]